MNGLKIAGYIKFCDDINSLPQMVKDILDKKYENNKIDLMDKYKKLIEKVSE